MSELTILADRDQSRWVYSRAPNGLTGANLRLYENRGLSQAAAGGGRLRDRDDIIAAANTGGLPELFVERLRRHRTDELGKAFRATLTKLHNDGTIDVLEPARQIATSPIDQHDFFTVMHVYTELIPTLDASVTDMLAAVKALSNRAGEDLASGMPNGAYRSWAEQGDRACDTLEGCCQTNCTLTISS